MTISEQSIKAVGIAVLFSGDLLQKIFETVAETKQDGWASIVRELYLVKGSFGPAFPSRPTICCLVRNFANADIQRRRRWRPLRAIMPRGFDKNQRQPLLAIAAVLNGSCGL